METYVVYVHENKINNKKYIGITCQNPTTRWANGKAYKNNAYFTNAIKKYGWDMFTHLILFTNLTKDEAEAKEIELIKKYDTTNPAKGYNISSGGNAHSGCKHSLESRKLISEHNARSRLGTHLSNEAKQKLSKERQGKNNPIHKHVFTESERKAISERSKLYQSNNKKFGKDNHKSKPVGQYDKYGNTIGIYDAVKEAERKTGIDCSSIINVCNHKRKTAGGFVWKYI